jgi:predicted metal-binding protein
MEGPKMNNGQNDAHADYMDNKNAITAWNKLPRNLREKKLERILKK